jgi:hypothetical protein
VLWSRVSVGSQWVRSEASYAADRGVLVPVLTEATAVPLRFRILQAVDLSGWSGSPDEPRLQQLLAGVRAVAAGPAGGGPVSFAPRVDGRAGGRIERRWAARVAAVLAAVAVVALSVVGGAALAARGGTERVSLDGPPSDSNNANVGPTTSDLGEPATTGGSRSEAEPPPHELALTPPAITPHCVARDSEDARGNGVSFAPENVVDGDPTSAWRCDGDAAGIQLVFTISPAATVTRIGLVPGYAKVDPYAGYDRFLENRRITAVTWICRRAGSEVARVRQSLDPGNRAMQSVDTASLGPCDAVWLQIDRVTAPGADGAVPKDYTAISDVSIQGRAA